MSEIKNPIKKRITFPSYIGFVREIEPSFLIRDNFPAQVIIFQIEGTEAFYNSEFTMQMEGQRVGLIREADIGVRMKVEYIINGIKSGNGRRHNVLKVMGVEKLPLESKSNQE